MSNYIYYLSEMSHSILMYYVYDSYRTVVLYNCRACTDYSLGLKNCCFNEKQTKVNLCNTHVSTMRSMLIPLVNPLVNYSKIFTWSYLCIKELVLSPLNSCKGISVATESPYGCVLVNLDRRGVLRQYYGKDEGIMCPEKGILRYIYGYSRGNSSVGTDPKKIVTKPFLYYLNSLTSAVHALLMNRVKELNLKGLDLSVCFNHCTSLLYFAEKTLKPASTMPYHCDVTYNHKGQYVDSANEQVENTPTVIISLGDNRFLNWQLQICLVNQKTGRLKWYNVCKTDFMKTINLEDKTILIINTLDERPFIDSETRCFMRYQHGNVTVKHSSFSCGLVLRVVKGKARYSHSNLIVETTMDDTDTKGVIEEILYHENFHKQLRHLFVEKFKKYET